MAFASFDAKRGTAPMSDINMDLPHFHGQVSA